MWFSKRVNRGSKNSLELVLRLNSCPLVGDLPEIWLFQSAVSYAHFMPALSQNIQRTQNNLYVRLQTKLSRLEEWIKAYTL